MSLFSSLLSFSSMSSPSMSMSSSSMSMSSGMEIMSTNSTINNLINSTITTLSPTTWVNETFNKAVQAIEKSNEESNNDETNTTSFYLLVISFSASLILGTGIFIKLKMKQINRENIIIGDNVYEIPVIENRSFEPQYDNNTENDFHYDDIANAPQYDLATESTH